MASERLVAARLTGDRLPGFPSGDSKPESMLDSEPLELRFLARGSSMVELYVQGDCDMDILTAAREREREKENANVIMEN